MYRPNNFGAVDLKTGLPVLDEKSFLKILVLPFSSKLDWGCDIVGDNTEKIWAHRFLAKPKTIEDEGLRGAVSPPWGAEQCLGERVGSNPLNNFAFFLVQHDKMVIVRVNIG